MPDRFRFIPLPVAHSPRAVLGMLKRGYYWFVVYPCKALWGKPVASIKAKYREIKPRDTSNPQKAYEVIASDIQSAYETVIALVNQHEIPERKGDLILEFKVRAPGLPSDDKKYIHDLIFGDEKT